MVNNIYIYINANNDLYYFILVNIITMFETVFFYGCLAEPSGWQWKEWGFNQQQ